MKKGMILIVIVLGVLLGAFVVEALAPFPEDEPCQSLDENRVCIQVDDSDPRFEDFDKSFNNGNEACKYYSGSCEGIESWSGWKWNPVKDDPPGFACSDTYSISHGMSFRAVCDDVKVLEVETNPPPVDSNTISGTIDILLNTLNLNPSIYCENDANCNLTECWKSENCHEKGCDTGKVVVWSYNFPFPEEIMAYDKGTKPGAISCCQEDSCAYGNNKCQSYNTLHSNHSYLCNTENNWLVCNNQTGLKGAKSLTGDFYCTGTEWIQVEANCSDSSSTGGYPNAADCADVTCNGKIGGAEGQLCEHQHELTCNDGFDNDGDGDGFVSGQDLFPIPQQNPSGTNSQNGEEIDYSAIYDFVSEWAEQNPKTSFKMNVEELNIFEMVGNPEFEEKENPSGPVAVVIYMGDGKAFYSTEKEFRVISLGSRASLPTEIGDRQKSNIEEEVSNREEILLDNGQEQIPLNELINGLSKIGDNMQAQAGSATAVPGEEVKDSWLSRLFNSIFGRKEAVAGEATNPARAFNLKLNNQVVTSAKDLERMQSNDKLLMDEIVDEIVAEGSAQEPIESLGTISGQGVGADCFDYDCYSQKKTGPNGAQCCSTDSDCTQGAICGQDHECHETICDANVDNDKDNLTQCLDPDCNGKTCDDKMVCSSGICSGVKGPGQASLPQEIFVQIFTYKSLLEELNKCELKIGTGVCNTICGTKMCVFADGGRNSCSEEGSTKCTCC